MSKKPMNIIGHFFHSFNDKNQVEWQGQVVGTHKNTHLIVETYDWLIGMNTVRMLVPITETYQWNFYETNEDMKFAYDTMSLYRKGITG